MGLGCANEDRPAVLNWFNISLNRSQHNRPTTTDQCGSTLPGIHYNWRWGGGDQIGGMGSRGVDVAYIAYDFAIVGCKN